LAHRLALVLLALAAPAALLAFCLGWPWIGALAGGVALPIALMILGAARRDCLGRPGRLGHLWLPLLALGLVLGAGWAAILALPHGGPDVAGLPLATALMIFVMIPLPLAVLGLAYALTFDRLGLSPEDLERVRAARGPGTHGTGA